MILEWQQRFLDCTDKLSVWIAPRQVGKSIALLLKSLNEPRSLILVPSRMALSLLEAKYEFMQETFGVLPRPEIRSYQDPDTFRSNDFSHVSQLLIDESDSMSPEVLQNIRPLLHQVNQTAAVGTPQWHNPIMYELITRDGGTCHRVHMEEQSFIHPAIEEFSRSMSQQAFTSEILASYPIELEAELEDCSNKPPIPAPYKYNMTLSGRL